MVDGYAFVRLEFALRSEAAQRDVCQVDVITIVALWQERDWSGMVIVVSLAVLIRISSMSVVVGLAVLVVRVRDGVVRRARIVAIRESICKQFVVPLLLSFCLLVFGLVRVYY